MNKTNLRLLLLTSLLLTNIIPTTARSEENTSIPVQSSKQSTSIVEAILSLFKSPERRFITRGDEVCLVSPGDSGEQLIWSDRPLFIWQGKIPESEINLTESTKNFGEEELVWTETVPENTQTIAYTGDELQLGATYDWELISNGTTYRQTITLMEESQREAIAAELAALENKLENNHATKEDIAIAKADYFIQQQLGYDALQQLYSVPNPSSSLTEQITEIERHLCNINE